MSGMDEVLKALKRLDKQIDRYADLCALDKVFTGRKINVYLFTENDIRLS